MKIILKFSACLEIDADDNMRDKMIPENEQVVQLKGMLCDDTGADVVEITDYHVEIK